MKYTAFFLYIFAMIPLSCEKKNDNPDLKGERKLGIHVTETDDLDFEQSFLIAKDAGMDCIPQVFYWNMLEESGLYDPEQLLDVINLFYPAHDMAVSLCISPIAAISRAVPGDLLDISFDDPKMISRFKQLLDTVHKKTPDLDMKFLLLGNEVDLYFSSHPDEWADYTMFVQEIVPYAKKYWPDLMIGVENTLGGILGPDRNQIKELNEYTDMVCFTYYPLNADFTMQPVESVKPVIEEMMDLYMGRTMFLEECGYATSEVCNSSQRAQADFVEEMFDIWDYYADRLIYVGFLWLHDIPEETAWFYVEEYGMKGQPNELPFKEYLRTTGLRTSGGDDKQGYRKLIELAEQRGW